MSFATLYANLIVIFNYLKSDLIKKQRAFKIGLISIYLVVFFITMLMNVISVSPTIFIRLSEDQVGEADFIFIPMLTKVDVSTAVNQSAFDKLILKNNKTSSFFDVKFIDFDDWDIVKDFYDFLKDIVCSLAGIKSIAPTLTPMCELAVTEGEAGKVIHLINLSGAFANYTYCEPLPIRDICIEMEGDADKNMETLNGGHVIRTDKGIKLDCLHGYEAIRIY